MLFYAQKMPKNDLFAHASQYCRSILTYLQSRLTSLLGLFLEPPGRLAARLGSYYISEANCLNSENSASAEFQPVASHEIVQPQQELRT